MVVVFKEQAGEDDGAEADDYGYRPCLREGEAVTPDIGIEEIHHRVVDDIDWIGYAAEKAAQSVRDAVAVGRRGSDIDNGGKDEQRAKQVVAAVGNRFAAVCGYIRHGKHGDNKRRAEGETVSPDPDGPEAACHEQTGREGERQAQQSADKDVIGHRPAEARVVAAAHVGECPNGQGGSRGKGECPQTATPEPVKPQGVADAAYILEEKRPARAIEREHLAVASDFGQSAGKSGQHKQTEKKRGYDSAGADNGTVPALATLNYERHNAEQDADDNHGLQTYDASDDKLPGSEAALPAAVIGVADDKTRENKEKVDGEIAVVETLVDGRCGKRFKDVIPDDKQSGDTTQAVENLISLWTSGSHCCHRNMLSNEVKPMKTVVAMAAATMTSRTLIVNDISESRGEKLSGMATERPMIMRSLLSMSRRFIRRRAVSFATR